MKFDSDNFGPIFLSDMYENINYQCTLISSGDAGQFCGGVEEEHWVTDNKANVYVLKERDFIIEIRMELND